MLQRYGTSTSTITNVAEPQVTDNTKQAAKPNTMCAAAVTLHVAVMLVTPRPPVVKPPMHR